MTTPTFVSSSLEITRDFLAVGMEKKYNENFTVNEGVGDAWVHGRGQSSGETYLKLAKNDKRAQIDLYYKGSVANQVTSSVSAGPLGRKTASASTTSQTGLHSVKSVFFDEPGFSLAPNKTNADTTLKITGVSLVNPNGRSAHMGQSEAWSQAHAKHGEMVAKTNQRAKTQLNQRIDRETGKEFSQPHADYLKKIYKPLIATKQFPGHIRSRSDESLMTIYSEQPIEAGLREKPVIAETNAVKFYLHEALLNQINVNKYSGKKLTLAEFKKSIADMMNRTYTPTEDDKTQSISFPQDKIPVEFKFADSSLTIIVRSSGYFIDDVRQPAMDVTVKYALALTDDGLVKATRAGEIMVLPPNYRDGDRLSQRQKDMQGELRTAYGEEFKPEVISKAFTLPAAWENAGKLVGTKIIAQDGWLAAAWTLVK